jgi:hypothetical protein
VKSALFAAGATAALVAPTLGAHASTGDVYLVTLTGMQQSVVTRAGSVEDELGCTFHVNDVDREVVTFTATRRIRLALRPGGALPRIALTARVTVSGSRHRESELTGGDPSLCDPGEPPRTTRCVKRVVGAQFVLRPSAGTRFVLGGALAKPAPRRVCATTLTRPDPFPLPSESRLAVPPRAFAKVFAKARVHSTTKSHGVGETTELRWTLVLRRA